MALGLRTMVVPTGGDDTMYLYRRGAKAGTNDHTRREWVMHLQVRWAGRRRALGGSRLAHRVRAACLRLCTEPEPRCVCVCVQAGAGLVADSVPEAEFEETVNKAAALGRAIDLAEQAFVGSEP